jgi:hypothetical protein
MNYRYSVAVLGAVLALQSEVSHAQVPGPATYNSYSYVQPDATNPYQSTETVGPVISNAVSQVGSYGSNATATSQIDATHRPYVSASTQQYSPVPVSFFGEPGYTGNSSEASSYLTYQFEVVAPGPSSAVPVLINANGNLSLSPVAASGNYSMQGQIALLIGGGNLQLYDWLSISNGFNYGPGGGTTNLGNSKYSGSIETGYDGSISENSVYSLQTNEIYTVQLLAEVYAEQISCSVEGGCGYNGDIDGGGVGGTQFGTATVDPTFQIAPGTPNFGDYKFEFSPGVGNGLASGVPELSTWAMMLIGFAGLGFAAYRQSKKSLTFLRS